MKCLPSASGPFHSGSSCDFSCDQGFELKGSKRLQCGPRGEWDSKNPTCSGTFSLEILFLCLPLSLPPSPLSLPQVPCVEIRGQLAEVDFLLMYGSQKWNSGCGDWRQVPSSVEPSCWPPATYFEFCCKIDATKHLCGLVALRRLR